MKRIVSLMIAVFILACMCSINTFALASPTATPVYGITITVNGTGNASADNYAVPVGDTVTLTATETNSAFVFWDLNGEWEIVSGDQYQKVITIKPLSDIEAVATFEDGMNEFAIPSHDKNSTSPKTGHNATLIYFILTFMCIACGSIMFSVCKINKK